MKHVKQFWQVCKKAGDIFFKNNGLKLCASLSFYTVFSIGPALLVIFSILGIFFDQAVIQTKLLAQIESITGNAASGQIMEVLKNSKREYTSAWNLITSSVILVLGATGVFTEIVDSINYILSVKLSPKRGWFTVILGRVLSISLLLGVSFILIVSLIINSLIEAFNERLFRAFPEIAVVAGYIANLLVTFLVTASLFALILRILPSASLRWKDIFAGAVFSALLVMAGKFLISLYITKFAIASAYGGAAALVVLLSWVYYSSMIFYFGAAFTKARAQVRGTGMRLKKNAVFIVKRESTDIPETVY